MESRQLMLVQMGLGQLHQQHATHIAHTARTAQHHTPVSEHTGGCHLRPATMQPPPQPLSSSFKACCQLQQCWYHSTLVPCLCCSHQQLQSQRQQLMHITATCTAMGSGVQAGELGRQHLMNLT